MTEMLGDSQALQQAIADSDADVVIAMSPENVPYASGVLLWTQRFIRDRLGLVVLPKEGEPVFITATNEEGYVREKTWIEDVRGYVQHRSSPVQVLADVLREKGLSAGRIAIEPGYLSSEHYRELVETPARSEFRFVRRPVQQGPHDQDARGVGSAQARGNSDRTRADGHLLHRPCRRDRTESRQPARREHPASRSRVAGLFVLDGRPQHRTRPSGPNSARTQGRRSRKDRLRRIFLRILFRHRAYRRGR